MIVECNVWCTKDSKLTDLGVDENNDCWMPIGIDFSKIEHIKLAGENYFIGNDRAAVGCSNGILIIDLTYEHAMKLWKQSKNQW